MQIQRIDHVHLEVSDREAAAEWYGRVLGLIRSKELAPWADDPMGPLVLAAPDGTPLLSLFARPAKPTSRDATIAYRTSAADFKAFLASLPRELKNTRGKTLTAQDVVDHDLSHSIYFLDPDENRIELTCYELDALK
ncbi:MAG: hypothetical protein CR993_08205 [Rhodobacterales bacterium]|nr:MAG: hypothetical protein CR993_08205 [Rhodobacterales bacterium]